MDGVFEGALVHALDGSESAERDAGGLGLSGVDAGGRRDGLVAEHALGGQEGDALGRAGLEED